MSSKLSSAQMFMDGIIRDDCYDGLNESFKNEVVCINDRIEEIKLNFRIVEDICLGQEIHNPCDSSLVDSGCRC